MSRCRQALAGCLLGLAGSAMLAWNASTASAADGAGGSAGASASFSHSAVRLVQGEGSKGVWSAGVEIKLADGWKTYWRMPGESGVAPYFDWSGSSNLADVEVRWPAPRRYHDAAGETIGYVDAVVFPLTVRAEQPHRPVELVLDLSYAVCNDICVPTRVELRSALHETAYMPAGAGLIGRFEDLVPRHNAPGLELGTVAVRENAGAARLEVVVDGTAVDTAAEIFVESAGYWYFGPPRPAGQSGEGLRFHLPIDGPDDATALKGQKLTLTVVTTTARLTREVTVR